MENKVFRLYIFVNWFKQEKSELINPLKKGYFSFLSDHDLKGEMYRITEKYIPKFKQSNQNLPKQRRRNRQKKN